MSHCSPERSPVVPVALHPVLACSASALVGLESPVGSRSIVRARDGAAVAFPVRLRDDRELAAEWSFCASALNACAGPIRVAKPGSVDVATATAICG
jgi:hypothetical protein